MKKVILVLLLAATVQQVSAQANKNTFLEGAAAERNFQDLKKLTTTTGTVQTYDNRYKGIKGSPFFWNNWGKGNLQIGDKEFENITAKYNVQEDEVWYQDAKGNAFILPATQLTSFALTDTLGLRTISFKRLPRVGQLEPALANKLLAVLHEGPRSQLVLAPQKKLLKADYKGPYSAGREFDQIIDVADYFLLFGERNVQKIKLNKRSFLKALPANQAQVEDFVKVNNIDLNTESGWVKALAIFETL
ncbi:hypothetical protein [Pontibacter akesuensis]|uniref:Uncharacterized protein n=1 Tax=Pontibacter akesuensis TaxID=388950 RepID=A0A1I7G438_9BACT|nr:hypothetical protein [Pontibacter akesuensis]GHA58944.1 hypothetical protein GCM10007389_08620 [Pontibacter akesuensis]SFU43209.1 hypothetical protein SAMN04487941_0702 [Pontibacter akesuensis]